MITLVTSSGLMVLSYSPMMVVNLLLFRNSKLVAESLSFNSFLLTILIRGFLKSLLTCRLYAWKRFPAFEQQTTAKFDCLKGL